MTDLRPPRRVVAGIGADGLSCVVSDGPPAGSAAPGMAIFSLWSGKATPVDNTAPLAECTGPFRMEQIVEPVYSVLFAEYAPGLGRDDPHMHFTNTADHFYVIDGEVVLVLENEEVILRAGDLGIIRGVRHGWRNDAAYPARLMTFILPAEPL